MQYVITVILSLISGVLLYLVQDLLKENKRLRAEKHEEEQKRDKAIADGVLSLLRVQLIEYHNKYMMGDNIPTYVYENFDDMYNAYAALGGNGMIKRMKEDIDKLRVANR